MKSMLLLLFYLLIIVLLSSYEEGIWIVHNSETPIVAVSPDGNLRASCDNLAYNHDVIFAFECKCPFPLIKIILVLY